MTEAAGASSRSRAMFAAAEPFTLGLLVNAEGRAALTALGVSDRTTYFVVRSAPLGRAGAAVVAAAFHGFPVALIAAALPAAWDVVTPAAVIDAHHSSLVATAQRIFHGAVDMRELGRVADLLTAAGADLDTSGRPLAAGNQALPTPDEPWSRLWQAANTLREYRGDAHIAALVAADLTVAESLAMTAAWAAVRIDTAMLRRTRQLTEAVWTETVTTLGQRGLMTSGGHLTNQGVALRDGIENQTDRASSRPWERMKAGDVLAAHTFLTTLSALMISRGATPRVTPVGAPWPPPPISG